jgi:hypothetical protein
MKLTTSPVPWTRWGIASRWLARLVPPQKPPLLVLSLPRSGSTWVGEIMGYGSRALYLREPVTQGDPIFYDRGTVFPLHDPVLRQAYIELGDRAFAGLPASDPNITLFPAQWALAQRRRRRVVIKEVNPLATEWYLERYRPRVIFLLRHPAAVALSFQKLGWLEDTPQAWEEHGAFQGRVLATAQRALATYDLGTTLFYGDACAAPEPIFRRLYDFAGLAWDEAVVAHLARRTSGQDSSNLWKTSRDSKAMIDAWRSAVSPPLLRALRRGFQTYHLPWYATDAFW